MANGGQSGEREKHAPATLGWLRSPTLDSVRMPNLFWRLPILFDLCPNREPVYSLEKIHYFTITAQILARSLANFYRQ